MRALVVLLGSQYDRAKASVATLEAMSPVYTHTCTNQAQRPASSVKHLALLENESEPSMLKVQDPEQQFAFKDLMIHLILQFTLHIAFRGVLHRCGNPEVHR